MQKKISTFSKLKTHYDAPAHPIVWISLKFRFWPKSKLPDFGQHRIAAMRKMAGGDDVIIPCVIYNDLTYEQEAELYYMLDRTRGRLRLSHATKALVESGSDAEIIDVKQRVEDAGIVWALGKPTGEPFEIATSPSIRENASPPRRR